MHGRLAGGQTLTADSGRSSVRDGLSRAPYSHQWLCVDAYGNETVPGKWHLDPDMCIPTRSLPNRSEPGEHVESVGVAGAGRPARRYRSDMRQFSTTAVNQFRFADAGNWRLPLLAALLLAAATFGGVFFGIVQAQDADGAITGLTLASDSPGELTVSWDMPSPAPTDHRVDWAKSGESYQSYKVDEGHVYPEGSVTTVTITDLEAGTEYKVRMRARYNQGEHADSPWSGPWQVASLTVAAEPTAEPTAEEPEDGAIGSPTATDDNAGGLVIAWQAPQAPHDAPTDYRVNWARSDDDYPSYTEEHGNAHPATTTHTLEGLDRDTEYKIRIRARYSPNGQYDAHWSGPWTEITARVASSPPDTRKNSGAPAAPSLIGTAVTPEGHVTLLWLDPSDDSITGYRVLRGPDADSLAVIRKDTGSTAISYTDTEADAGQTHAYAVQARSAAGLSPLSNTRTATVPASEPDEEDHQDIVPPDSGGDGSGLALTIDAGDVLESPRGTGLALGAVVSLTVHGIELAGEADTFRIDLVDSDGNAADGCEGEGMGHDRRLFPDFLDWMLLNPAETFTVSAELGSGCSNGATYTVTASVSDETLTERAAATASFEVLISARGHADTPAALVLGTFTVTYTDSNGDEVVISPSLVSGTTDYVIELPSSMRDDNISIAWTTATGAYGYGYRTSSVGVQESGSGDSASKQYHVGNAGARITWWLRSPIIVRTHDGGAIFRHVFVTDSALTQQRFGTETSTNDRHALDDYKYAGIVPSGHEIAQVPHHKTTEYNFDIRRERSANAGHTTIREAGAVLCSTHTPVPGAPSPGTFVADPVNEYSPTGGLLPLGRAKALVSFITQVTGAASHPYTHNSAGRPDYSDATICNAPRSHQIWYSTHRQQLEQALANSTGAHTAYGAAHQGPGPGEFSPHVLMNVETDIPAPRLSASDYLLDLNRHFTHYYAVRVNFAALNTANFVDRLGTWSPIQEITSRELFLGTRAALETLPLRTLPLIQGRFAVGETLTADPDDPANREYSYQWIRVDAAGAETEIAEATNKMYTVDAADAGNRLMIRVVFIDDDGTEEVLTSPATSYVPGQTRTLVSNIHQSAPNIVSNPVGLSTGFVTGPGDLKHRIETVIMNLHGNTTQGLQSDRFRLRLFTSTSDSNTLGSKPAAEIAAFSHPGGLNHAGWQRFQAPSQAVLDGGGAYHLAMTTGGAGTVGCLGTASTMVDSGSVPAWTPIYRTHYLDREDPPFHTNSFVDGGVLCTFRVIGHQFADAPHITSLEITSTPNTSPSYETGETIRITATLSEAVSFTGPAPILSLLIGANTREAVRVASLSTATQWVFEYVVQDDDRDDGGISIERHALRAYADADLSHNAISTDAGRRVNARPLVRSIRVTSKPEAPNWYGPGETIQFTAEFSMPVTVTGDPEFAFSISGVTTRARATYISATENKVVFEYTVSATDDDSDGIWIGDHTDTFRLDGDDTIVGAGNGRTAVLDHQEVGKLASHRIDQNPRIVTVAVTSDPTHGANSDTYAVGDTIEFTATFNQEVNVVGDPEFEFSIDTGTTNERAAYHSGSGMKAIVFRYTILAADNDPSGIWIGDQTRTFKLDADDSIQGVSNSLDAVLNHRGLSTQTGHKIDNTITP